MTTLPCTYPRTMDHTKKGSEEKTVNISSLTAIVLDKLAERHCIGGTKAILAEWVHSEQTVAAISR